MNADFVKFPDQPQIMREKIIESIAENNFHEAAMYAERLFNIEQTFETNFLCANLLFEVSEFEKAYQVSKIFEDNYLKNLDYRGFYVEVLIHSSNLLRAQKIIEETLREDLPLEILEQWKEYEQHYQNLAKGMTVPPKPNISIEEIEAFLIDPPAHIAGQKQFIDKLYEDSPEQLIHHAQELFLHQSVFPSIKAEILERLIDHRVTDEYYYPWLDDEIIISPAQCEMFSDLDALKDLESIVIQLIGANEQLKELIIAEYIYQCLLLYPLTDKIITDKKLWLDILADRLQGKKIHSLEINSKQFEEISEMMDKLDQLVWKDL